MEKGEGEDGERCREAQEVRVVILAKEAVCSFGSIWHWWKGYETSSTRLGGHLEAWDILRGLETMVQAGCWGHVERRNAKFWSFLRYFVRPSYRFEEPAGKGLS